MRFFSAIVALAAAAMVGTASACSGTFFLDGTECSATQYIAIDADICYTGDIQVDGTAYASTKTTCAGSDACTWATFTDEACKVAGFSLPLGTDCSCNNFDAALDVELVGIRVLSYEGEMTNKQSKPVTGADLFKKRKHNKKGLKKVEISN